MTTITLKTPVSLFIYLFLLASCSPPIAAVPTQTTGATATLLEESPLPTGTAISLATQTSPATVTPLPGATSTPTLAPTLTSQPAPPILIYPPDGAVLTQSLTIQQFEYLTTGFVTYVTVTGENFTARYCVASHSECMPYHFENETMLLLDGDYTWTVFTSKPLGSATSETWHFQIDTDTSDNE
jgi:hypothetical protein